MNVPHNKLIINCNDVDVLDASVLESLVFFDVFGNMFIAWCGERAGHADLKKLNGVDRSIERRDIQ